MEKLSDTNWREGGKDVYGDWWQYPSNVIPEPATTNLQSYNDRIADVRSEIFYESSSETNLEIIDVECKVVV